MQERHILGAVRAHNRKVHGAIDVFDTVCQLEHELDCKDKRIDWLERQLPGGNMSNRIEYTVCEKCKHRNTELLDTVAQLEQELALLTESNEDLQHKLGQLEWENVALQSKLERQRVSYGRRTAQLSAWSTAYKYKLKHLVSKFRKLKTSEDNTVYLVEANKNLQYNETLAAARIKELEQCNDLLTEECNSLNDMLNAKENKLSLRVDKLEQDTKELSWHLTELLHHLSEKSLASTRKETCICRTSDEDKRPSESKDWALRRVGKTAAKSSPEELHESMKENAIFPGV